MTKLSKVNKNGSLSIILPKAFTKDIWNAGDEVNVEPIGVDAILIDRQKLKAQPLNIIFSDLTEGIESLRALRGTLKQGTVNSNLVFNEEMYRKTVKQFLLEILRRI